MPDEDVPTQTPHGLWAILGLIESVINASLHAGEIESNLIVADLVQFEDEELPHVRHTTELVIVGGDETRALLFRLAGNGLDETQEARSGLRKVRLNESVDRVIDSTRLNTDEENLLRFPLPPSGTEDDVRWSVRQVLSTITSSIAMIDLDEETARKVILERLREYEEIRLRWLAKAADLVIMAAALVLAELDAMITPPGTFPLHRRRRRPSPKKP